MTGYDPMTSVAALEHVKTRACQCKPYKRYACPSCALPIARRADDRLAAVTANRDAMRELLTQLRDTGNFPAEWYDAFNAVLSHDPRG